jgi:hypothetical protein
MAHPQNEDAEDCLQEWRTAASVFNKQSRTADERSSFPLAVGLEVKLSSP